MISTVSSALMQVSIPETFVTDERMSKNLLVVSNYTVNGVASFLAGTSISIHKLPPNPSIGYKLQFNAISSQFPNIGPGYSDFFRIIANKAVAIGISRQIASGSVFYVFSPLGGDLFASI